MKLMTLWSGGPGDDQRSGGAGSDTLFGYAGDDTLRGEGGGDFLYGGRGSDELYGDRGADRLFGGRGADILHISGLDTVNGGAGADFFLFGDQMNGNAGEARIKDFDAVGADHDKLGLGAFSVRWKDRDAGLEDGFEIVASGNDVIVRMVSGPRNFSVVLEDTRLADLTKADFDFFIFPID